MPYPQNSAPARLDCEIDALCQRHLPSKHPLFKAIVQSPKDVFTPGVLGEFYTRYQAAMHSTRAAVYRLPHLDSPALRVRKLQIFVDDDGLNGGDTHHYQLRRAFTNIGAEIRMSDDEFGDLEELAGRLDPATAQFVRAADRLYPRSLGPFCIVETLSNDWMTNLCEALSAHFPGMREEPYFAECAEQHVEERHGREALDLAKAVVDRSPELLPRVVEDAREMAENLDRLWDCLHTLVHESGRVATA